MPTYEYECQRCKKIQEKFHKMAEENKESCEDCKAPAEELKKVLSPIRPHVSWSSWNIQK